MFSVLPQDICSRHWLSIYDEHILVLFMSVCGGSSEEKENGCHGRQRKNINGHC